MVLSRQRRNGGIWLRGNQGCAVRRKRTRPSQLRRPRRQGRAGRGGDDRAPQRRPPRPCGKSRAKIRHPRIVRACWPCAADHRVSSPHPGLRGSILLGGRRRLDQGGSRGRRECHLLSDVRLHRQQCGKVLSYLFLPRCELLDIAPHGIEAGCRRRRLLRRVERCKDGRQPGRRQQPGQHWSPGHHRLPCHIAIGLPGERTADTDQNRHHKPDEATEYSSADRRPVAGHLIALAAEGMKGMDRRRRGPRAAALIESGVRSARRPAGQSLPRCRPFLLRAWALWVNHGFVTLPS